MPATLTSRLKLVKSALVDNADITVNVNPSLDIIDAETGLPKIASGGGLPGTPYDGQVRYDRNDGFTKVWDAIAGLWVPLLAGPGASLQGNGGSWKTFVPTLTGVTLGTPNQKNFMEYIRLPGNIIAWRYLMVLGTGGALTAVMTVSLPTEFPVDVAAATLQAYTGSECVGSGFALAASRGPVSANISAVGPPGTLFFSIGATGLNVQNGQPGAWAATNFLTAEGWYRTSAA